MESTLSGYTRFATRLLQTGLFLLQIYQYRFSVIHIEFPAAYRSKALRITMIQSQSPTMNSSYAMQSLCDLRWSGTTNDFATRFIRYPKCLPRARRTTTHLIAVPCFDLKIDGPCDRHHPGCQHVKTGKTDCCNRMFTWQQFNHHDRFHSKFCAVVSTNCCLVPSQTTPV